MFDFNGLLNWFMSNNNQITEVANWVFVVAGQSTVFMLVLALLTGFVKGSNVRAVIAVILILQALVIRIGYWALAIKFAPIGESFNPTYKEWKWLMTVLTSVVFAIGCVGFMGFLRSLSIQAKIIVFIAVFSLATFLGFL